MPRHMRGVRSQVRGQVKSGVNSRTLGSEGHFHLPFFFFLDERILTATVLVFADYVCNSPFPNRLKNLLWETKWTDMLPELAFNCSDLLDRNL